MYCNIHLYGVMNNRQPAIIIIYDIPSDGSENVKNYVTRIICQPPYSSRIEILKLCKRTLYYIIYRYYIRIV